ncbi:hypothetical protein HMPREF1367_02370, partial [Enterococcus faecium ERV38]|uniref:hypothetical protein n=1 Tax=Enterococcus faecium TaxID=1352 RepID=UPI0002829ADD
SSPTRFDEEPKKVTTVLCRSSFFRVNGVNQLTLGISQKTAKYEELFFTIKGKMYMWGNIVDFSLIVTTTVACLSASYLIFPS